MQPTRFSFPVLSLWWKRPARADLLSLKENAEQGPVIFLAFGSSYIKTLKTLFRLFFSTSQRVCCLSTQTISGLQVRPATGAGVMLVDRGTRFTARGKPIYRESVLPLVLLVSVSELPFIVWGGAWSAEICDCCGLAACLAPGSFADFPRPQHHLELSPREHRLALPR